MMMMTMQLLDHCDEVYLKWNNIIIINFHKFMCSFFSTALYVLYSPVVVRTVLEK
jgi:hypothetical protein